MSRFTKKTYELVAGIVAAISDESERWALAKLHADKFAADNKRFDRDRFYAACGVSHFWKASVK